MDTLYDYFIGGALVQGGSWGGPECMGHMSMETHVMETAGWLLFSAVVWYALDIGSVFKSIKIKESECKVNILDMLLGCVHFGMYLHLLYFKTNSKALVIVLLQPCHVILLLEGIALVSRGKMGVNISIFLLPALSGTLLAMLFPDTSGLYQWLEAESYWVQHYLIQAVPLYLLCRRNFQALNQCSTKTALAGFWILHVLHYTLYEGFDLMTSVNIEFMLCPTGAMNAIFTQLPPGLLWPSYRTPLTTVVIFVAIGIALFYIFVGRLIQSMVGTKPKKAKKL